MRIGVPARVHRVFDDASQNMRACQPRHASIRGIEVRDRLGSLSKREVTTRFVDVFYNGRVSAIDARCENKRIAFQFIALNFQGESWNGSCFSRKVPGALRMGRIGATWLPDHRKFRLPDQQ